MRADSRSRADGAAFDRKALQLLEAAGYENARAVDSYEYDSIVFSPAAGDIRKVEHKLFRTGRPPNADGSVQFCLGERQVSPHTPGRVLNGMETAGALRCVTEMADGMWSTEGVDTSECRPVADLALKWVQDGGYGWVLYLYSQLGWELRKHLRSDGSSYWRYWSDIPEFRIVGYLPSVGEHPYPPSCMLRNRRRK